MYSIYPPVCVVALPDPSSQSVSAMADSQNIVCVDRDELEALFAKLQRQKAQNSKAKSDGEVCAHGSDLSPQSSSHVSVVARPDPAEGEVAPQEQSLISAQRQGLYLRASNACQQLDLVVFEKQQSQSVQWIGPDLTGCPYMAACLGWRRAESCWQDDETLAIPLPGLGDETVSACKELLKIMSTEEGKAHMLPDFAVEPVRVLLERIAKKTTAYWPTLALHAGLGGTFQSVNYSGHDSKMFPWPAPQDGDGDTFLAATRAAEFFAKTLTASAVELGLIRLAKSPPQLSGGSQVDANRALMRSEIKLIDSGAGRVEKLFWTLATSRESWYMSNFSLFERPNVTSGIKQLCVLHEGQFDNLDPQKDTAEFVNGKGKSVYQFFRNREAVTGMLDVSKGIQTLCCYEYNLEYNTHNEPASATWQHVTARPRGHWSVQFHIDRMVMHSGVYALMNGHEYLILGTLEREGKPYHLVRADLTPQMHAILDRAVRAKAWRSS